MSVTYTSAADRTLRLSRARRWQAGWSSTSVGPGPGALLILASLVSLFAVALTYAGSRPAAAVQVVNLNAAATADVLQPPLAVLFPDPVERRARAQAVFQFLSAERARGVSVRNVGALAGVLSPSHVATLKPLLSVRTPEEFRRQVVWFAILYVLGFHLVALLWRLRGLRVDPYLLVVAHLLTAIGFAALLARPDPLRDTILVGRYTEGILIGLALMAAVSLIDFKSMAALELSFLPLAAALALSALLVGFGTGPSGSSAKVNLGPVQPIEAIRLLLGFFLAGYFARRWELVRGVRQWVVGTIQLPRWLNLPRVEYVIPVVVGVGSALLFFVLQKDLGPALYTCCVFLAVFAVARGRVGLTVAGLALLLLGFYAGYALNVSQTLIARVAMWLQPWNNGVAGGDQIAHALWAMSTGAVTGTGLGLGDTRFLPAGHTDLILAAIGEEQGAIGLLVVAVLYGMLAWRGFRIGRLAHADYGFFLATTMTLFLIIPTLIMAAGIVGAVPLTGVVTPFLSYGGSAMVTNFVALGVLTSIHADRRPPIDFAPFRMPMRWLGGVLATAAVLVLAVVVSVQVVYADEYVVQPHLGVQGDGGRRFVYNPRVLELVREIPRGSVYDRRGLPLATNDAAVIARARAPYNQLDIRIEDVCRDGGERCYPLRGRGFHLLGDARSRLNWSAPNTSYVERDGESTLRGFDDKAAMVDGALRRDYSPVVPLLRQRRDDGLTAFLAKPRDVSLTIDAAFQLRVASIVAAYANRSSGKGAAVVLDADTGELLASASYPWPQEPVPGVTLLPHEHEPDALLDRARYGLYPPGSTFKLVTASAALREQEGLQRSTFACGRLSDGRVGAKIAGWNRPIRDDVLDSHPHGRIDLHDGLVRSCNAYFAQLAIKLGAGPLMATAGQLGISLTDAQDARARVNGTLPQIGYGQADVVATPMRMARVAAAIASDGRLREVRWIKTGTPKPPDLFLDRASARLLAQYMRDAVTTGTGRSLRDHSGRIAGKTGTAEVAGKPSHSWFVGFAPFGSSTRRIAFAVIIENAGYGSANAAPAAGEIVAAAAATGLLK
jgi:cell division protein FtsW (lipid II flippase)